MSSLPTTASRDRLFVCDPVCVQEFGHNVAALKYFATSMAPSFAEIVPLCCRYLPEPLVREHGFVPHFGFYYENYIPLPAGPAVEDDAPISLDFVDPTEAAASADAAALLERWAIGADDALFFPGLDFYGIVGLLNALKQHEPDAQPRVFLRFIGVMENATGTYREPLAELILRLREALADGIRLSFGAETPKYADMLAGLLDVPVACLPYPSVGEIMPLNHFGPFTVFCPGSARSDKGYFDLWSIFAETRRHDFDLSVRFVTQILPDRDAVHWEHYTSQLSALPGVELLPATISQAEMLERYRQCHAVLLPYDRGIYALRGSAVMMEAAYFGRSVVTLGGTAFAEQVRYYGLGSVVSDIGEMAGSVLALSRQPRARMETERRQARFRFVADSALAYRQWIGAGQ
jgi:glycosyltransferase involved in cell wall biosynthesis